MRIRLPFAGVFFLLLLLAGYAGLTSLQLDVYVNDKVLHLLTFFLLTLVFYWVVDTNRRRTLNLALIVCTGLLGVGSEFLQGFLPNGRVFDPYDLVANVVGSLAGLALCSWYHKRMLERKRQHKQYGAVPGEDGDDEEAGLVGPAAAGEDVELGEGVGGGAAGTSGRAMTLEQEVDNWDENAEDAWDDDDAGDVGVAKGKPAEANGDHAEAVKRSD